MKSIIFALLAILVVSNAYASREAQYRFEDETNFGKVGVTGGATAGNPGYLALIGPNQGSINYTYYIWVNGTGNLCIASYPTISAYASFPSGNWNVQGSSMGCTVVGSQS